MNEQRDEGALLADGHFSLADRLHGSERWSGLLLLERRAFRNSELVRNSRRHRTILFGQQEVGRVVVEKDGGMWVFMTHKVFDRDNLRSITTSGAHTIAVAALHEEIRAELAEVACPHGLFCFCEKKKKEKEEKEKEELGAQKYILIGVPNRFSHQSNQNGLVPNSLWHLFI